MTKECSRDDVRRILDGDVDEILTFVGFDFLG